MCAYVRACVHACVWRQRGDSPYKAIVTLGTSMIPAAYLPASSVTESTSGHPSRWKQELDFIKDTGENIAPVPRAETVRRFP